MALRLPTELLAEDLTAMATGTASATLTGALLNNGMPLVSTAEGQLANPLMPDADNKLGYTVHVQCRLSHGGVAAPAAGSGAGKAPAPASLLGMAPAAPAPAPEPAAIAPFTGAAAPVPEPEPPEAFEF